MTKLFGVPIDQLMTVLLAVFGIGAAVLVVSALRNRTAFKMGVRNIPRRKSQTVLIVLGLMLATLLFSASFTTGDTLTNSIRMAALKGIGQVDVTVKAKNTDSSAGAPMGIAPGSRQKYFDQSLAGKVRDRLSQDKNVAGVAPLAVETAPVAASGKKLSEPQTDILGIDGKAMRGFDRLTTSSGSTLSVSDLSKNQVYISSEEAKKLGVGRGDEVKAYLGSKPQKFGVAGVYEKGANPASETSLVMPLERLQKITGNEGRINEILITHKGPAVEGGAHTKATLAELKPLLKQHDLKADPVKKDTLKQADKSGASFSNIFLMFGQFSVAAGVLLIFLIFVMLAAERKHELGIARGVGMQRSHLIRMFAFEGALYALLASAVGSLLGIGVGWGMVKIIGAAFAQMDFKVVFATSPQNVIIAFTLGMVLTFAVVLISSWRVSRLNVIRAIRDIPEPQNRRGGIKGLLFAILLISLGALMLDQSFAAEKMVLYMGGISLLIIGAALALRRFRLPDRVAFTLAGAGLLFLWLAPVKIAPDNMSQGIEMFFLSGIMIVIGAVWILIYNADILLAAVVATFGRIRGLPPVLKTAVKYPMQSRFRTGMTLAMFSLVVFTIVVMGYITGGLSSVWDNPNRLSGGFDLRASTGYTNPISNMNAALKNTKGINSNEFTAVGSLSNLPVKAKQDGKSGKLAGIDLQGVDRGYADNVSYGFAMKTKGYSSAREVWRALESRPDTVVVAANLVPSRSNFGAGDQKPPFSFKGFYQEQKRLPDNVYVRVKNPQTGETERLHVIGVLNQTAAYAGEMMTSQKTLDKVADAPVPAQSYMFRLKDGANAGAAAKKLEKAFLANGLQAEVTAKEIHQQAGTSLILNNLLTGFMGLGLLVGIAALGVIAARSVVERRQQIGVLRAVGFQRGQVRFAFLLESSFISLLGIATGIALGVGLSGTIIENMAKSVPGVTYQAPWTMIGIVIVVAYGASLLTTFLPARQASKVYPAEALRYE